MALRSSRRISRQPQAAVSLKRDRTWALVDCPSIRLQGDANATATYAGTAAVKARADGIAVALQAAGDYVTHGTNSKLQLSTCSGVIACRLSTLADNTTLFTTKYESSGGLIILVSTAGIVGVSKQDIVSIGTSSNAVAANAPIGIAWSYNATTGRLRLAVNGVLTSATSTQSLTHGEFVRGRYRQAFTANSTAHDQYLFAISPNENFSDKQLIEDSLNPWGIFESTSPRSLIYYKDPRVAVTPSQGLIAITGQTPAIKAGAKIYPTQCLITFAGQIPKVSMDAVRANPVQGIIAVSGQSPGFSIGYAGTPMQGVIAIVGKAPDLATGYTGTPTQGDIIVTGGQVKHSSYTVFARPNQGVSAVTGLSPSLKLGQAITPIRGAISVSGQVPLFADRVLKPIPPIWIATRYRCYLTGAASLADLELPISSFQTRINSASVSYLSCVLKGADNYTDAIALRSNGQLRIFRVYVLSDGSESTYLMANVLFEQIDLSTGGRSGVTAQLSGTGNMVPATAKSMTLQNPSYFGLSGGKHRYRCELDPRVRPGDTITINGDTFVVGGITHIVDTTFEMMEIAEA